MPHDHPTTPTARPSDHFKRMLITAGPTHEPIDAVRYIGNRSSGKMGVALADAAARAGWNVTLALGPVASRPEDSHVRVIQFRTASNLDTILTREHDHFDVLVMAAAVADYRPKVDPAMANAKFRRTDQSMTLQLEPTPDLIAGVGKRRRPGQFLVAFALEPRDEMIASGRAKMQRKNVDMVVANPLGTMDSDGIEGVVLLKDGRELRPASADGTLKKDAFAAWLITQIDREAAASASPSH